MAVTSWTMGPGNLQIGPMGTEKDFSCQIISATLTPDKDEEDDLRTLCGDVVPGAVVYTWTLEGEMVQDALVSASSLIKWTWDHKGEQMDFTFEPVEGDGLASITGTLVVDPLPLGGEVGQKPTAEFEFKVIGDPNWSDQTGS